MVEIKKIVHIADIHMRTYRLHKEYKEVMTDFISHTKEQLSDYDYEETRIVIVGDLVHQKITISNELLMLGTWFLRELSNLAPVVIIAGNHDLLEYNKDRLDSITPMVDLLPDANITYYKGESNCYLDNNIVWCVYSIFDDNNKPDINLKKIEFGEDKTYIGLYHAPILDATTDIGYVFDHGTELDHFEGCDVVMCGDIHKRACYLYKDDKGNNIKIVMPGSLIQQNFGENVSKHGYLLWDIKTLEYSEFDILNNYSYYKYKIKSSEDISDNKEILMNR